jgi:hypothetical protein
MKTIADIKNRIKLDKKLASIKNGLSAYEIAVKQGFVGTEYMWLKTLKGEQGSKPEGEELKKYVEAFVQKAVSDIEVNHIHTTETIEKPTKIIEKTVEIITKNIDKEDLLTEEDVVEIFERLTNGRALKKGDSLYKYSRGIGNLVELKDVDVSGLEKVNGKYVLGGEVGRDWWHYIGSTKYNNIVTIITNGKVFTYTYTPTSTTIYRYITTATTGLYPTEDSFYSTFDGTTLSDLITTR